MYRTRTLSLTRPSTQAAQRHVAHDPSRDPPTRNPPRYKAIGRAEACFAAASFTFSYSSRISLEEGANLHA